MHTDCKSLYRRLPLRRDAPVLHAASKRGQSLIEACLAMGIICLVFFGLFQVSQLAAAREILHHAAARGTRAKTVGFNHFMVSKAIRVAAIPNAGRITEPAFVNEDWQLRNMLLTLRPGELWNEVLSNTAPSSLQEDLESARIPDYMGSENWAQADYILDYEDWDSVEWTAPAFVPDGDTIDIPVSQEYPLRIPLHRTFYAPDPNANGEDIVLLNAVSSLEGHYPLYLDDQDW